MNRPRERGGCEFDSYTAFRRRRSARPSSAVLSWLFIFSSFPYFALVNAAIRPTILRAVFLVLRDHLVDVRRDLDLRFPVLSIERNDLCARRACGEDSADALEHEK